VLGWSGALAAGGLGGALLADRAGVAVVGLGLVGIGLANTVPVLFGTAGRVPGLVPGAALAAVATTGYAGHLAGPILIGLAASAVGLPVALGLVVAACAVIGAGARLVPASRPAAARASRPGVA
jgi:hypothetical protein